MRTKLFALSIFFVLAFASTFVISKKIYADVGFCNWSTSNRTTSSIDYTVNSCSPSLDPSKEYNLQIFDSTANTLLSWTDSATGSAILTNTRSATPLSSPYAVDHSLFIDITDASNSATYWVSNSDNGIPPTAEPTPIYIDIATHSAVAKGIHDLVQLQWNEFLIIIISFGILIGSMFFFLS